MDLDSNILIRSLAFLGVACSVSKAGAFLLGLGGRGYLFAIAAADSEGVWLRYEVGATGLSPLSDEFELRSVLSLKVDKRETSPVNSPVFGRAELRPSTG